MGSLGSESSAPSEMAGGSAVDGSAAAILSVKDLVKRFDGFPAVDRISFEVRAGEIFAFLGPMPGISMMSRSPRGTFFLSSSAYAILPVARYSAILAAILSPTPGIPRSPPAAVTSSTGSGRDATACAALS